MTTSPEHQHTLLQQQDLNRRSALLSEARHLLWKVYDYDGEEIKRIDTTTTVTTTTATTTEHHHHNNNNNNNNDDDIDVDNVMAQKPPSLLSSSSSSMVRELATLYDRLCETLTSDTFIQEIVIVNNNNNIDDNNKIRKDNIGDLYPIQPLPLPTQPPAEPWQVIWEMYQALQLISLLLLMEQQKIMEWSSDVVGVVIVAGRMEQQKTTLLSTIRQCQIVTSQLQSSYHGGSSSDTILQSTTTTINNNNQPYSWQQRIQKILQEHPTLLLPPPPPPLKQQELLSIHPQVQEDDLVTHGSVSSFSQHDQHQQQPEEITTNLLLNFNQKELDMEAQTLMQMANTPIPIAVPLPNQYTPLPTTNPTTE
jgi:hypothetical protein